MGLAPNFGFHQTIGEKKGLTRDCTSRRGGIREKFKKKKFFTRGQGGQSAASISVRERESEEPGNSNKEKDRKLKKKK